MTRTIMALTEPMTPAERAANKAEREAWDTAIRDAVLAEREACAKVADEFEAHHRQQQDNGRRTIQDRMGEGDAARASEAIASSIRSRSKD
jgi:hypothetical protein